METKEKSFKTVPMKRLVQSFILSNITPEINQGYGSITCLVDKEQEDYLQLLSKFDSVLRVNNNPKINADIIGDIADARLHRTVDCDFCATPITCGDTLIEVYNRMKAENKNKKRKYLLFTFSIRGTKQAEVDQVKAFFKRFYGTAFYYKKTEKPILLAKPGNKSYIKTLPHFQAKFDQSILFQYRDSSPMISGMVSWV